MSVGEEDVDILGGGVGDGEFIEECEGAGEIGETFGGDSGECPVICGGVGVGSDSGGDR